jgi:hypothetical protein
MDFLVIGGSSLLGREIIRQPGVQAHGLWGRFATTLGPSLTEWRPLDITSREDVAHLVRHSARGDHQHGVLEG